MKRSVLHIISSMSRGGRERQLAIIVKHSMMIDNRIICFHSCDTGYIDQYGLQDKSYYCGEHIFWKRVRDVVKVSKESNINVIISWGNLESIIAMFVSFCTGIPFVNFSIRHGIRSSKWSHYLRTIVLQLSKHVVANSIAGLKANNLSNGLVLYNGIEDIADTQELNKNTLLRGIERPGINGVVMISVANLVPYKDYFTVLRAIKVLNDMGVDFTYLIIGEGPNRSSIEYLIASFHLNDRVKLLGSIVNVDEYYLMSDIMIHSSMGEGCSNAILEAMKWGLPVVATKVGGTPEIVNDKCGILFEYQDEKALTEALIKLIEDPDLRQQMSLEAHRVVKERFSVEAMIENYESIVLNMVK